MATQFEIDCALMTGRVYESTRTKDNLLPVPDGWLARRLGVNRVCEPQHLSNRWGSLHSPPTYSPISMRLPEHLFLIKNTN
jgi:hypothetical protein